jgi:hypothetical protein
MRRRLMRISGALILLVTLVGGALATPPPPPLPPQLRTAEMRVKVRLIEAKGGTVTGVTTLCETQGRIPVYAGGNDSPPALHEGSIPGCEMSWKGRKVEVLVHGAIASIEGPAMWASARVSVTPPDAKRACPICGPQSLAASDADVRVSGAPKMLTFGLQPNPGSILRSDPTVWLEAEVVIVDSE